MNIIENGLRRKQQKCNSINKSSYRTELIENDAKISINKKKTMLKIIVNVLLGQHNRWHKCSGVYFFSWWILDLSYLGVYRLWLLPQYSLLPMLEQYSPSITCTLPFRLLAWQVLAIFMLSVTWGKF